MRKTLSTLRYGLLAVPALALMLSSSIAMADATSSPTFSFLSGMEEMATAPASVPGTIQEYLINKGTSATSKNTKELVDQTNEHIDSTRSGNAGVAVISGGNRDGNQHVDKTQAQFEKRDEESRKLSQAAKLDHGGSTSGSANTGGPETATRAVLENAKIKKITTETFDQAIVGLQMDPKSCTGQNCQMKNIMEKGKAPLGIEEISDLFRNGCDTLGICELMAQNIRNAQGKLLADVGPATKKNMEEMLADASAAAKKPQATLIAAGGGSDCKGCAMNICKLAGRNNPLDPSDEGVKAALIGGIVRVPKSEDFVDLYQKDKAKSIDGLDANFKRLYARTIAQGAMQGVINTAADSFSRKGGCPNQQNMQKGVKSTGMKGTDDGKCASNNELREDQTGASQLLAGKAGQTDSGNGPQAAKGRDALGRLRDTSNAILGSGGSSTCGGSGKSNTAVAELYDIPLLKDPTFLAMLQSKEFMVAYIDAPKIGEGSYFDSMNIMIANAWEKYEGTGAMMYAYLMLDKPALYASNEQKYASVFKFKPMPYEKGNMYARLDHDRFDPNYNQYTHRIEKNPPTAVANVEAPAVQAPVVNVQAAAVPTNELPVVDMSNITLQELFQKVGISYDPNGALSVPTSVVIPAAKAPDDQRVELGVPAMKATLVSTAGITQ